MQLNLKQKITVGILFLFFLLLLTGGVCIYYLVQLRNDARIILKDNYESLEFCHGMLRQLDSLAISPQAAISKFDAFLQKQEVNITESGEKEATAAVRNDFNKLQNNQFQNYTLIDSIQEDIQLILQLNMIAIERKNEQAEATADQALIYISIIATFIFFIALGFIINFPGYIANPIIELTQGIRAIANKHYDQRIHLDTEDELGEMARAFNTMAQKLNEYEHSNLAKILFEKSRAEAVINSLQDASIGVDSNHIVLFANEPALQLLNMTASEMIGKSAPNVAVHNDLFRFILDNNQSATFKIVLDGKESFFIREKNHIIKDQVELGIVYTLKNITSFQEKDIAKTNFLATISHELKTPLASTDIGLKLLENNKTGQLTENQREILEDLKKDNQRLIKLVSELLDVTQAEAGNINLNIGKVDVREVILYAIETVKNQAKEKGVSIDVQIPENAPRIKADREKAAWVLVNLLSNAIRYSPEKETITIMIAEQDGKVRVEVSDKGPGIPIQYRNKIFQRFFTIPGQKQGSGLGLSISREFMEAMNGSIRIEDKAGGATFMIEFLTTNNT
ncbi:MAG: ATP-binding protein [Saprospiraceae bacterium]|nr:ATP-binding protein [Saprospiraceae bacterium]